MTAGIGPRLRLAATGLALILAAGQAAAQDVTVFAAASLKNALDAISADWTAETGKVATEQSYIGELNDGTKNDMHNCNFFDVDADGKFSRVIIWMAGTNPLK